MTHTLDTDFFKKLLQTIEEANKKQTEELKVEIESVKQAVKEEANKRNILETEFETLKNKYENLEKSLRKNNIIIFGLEKTTEEILVNFVVEKLNYILSLNLNIGDINDVYTIGKKENNKPIIVKFVSYLTKREVLKKCYKLKDINKTKIIKIYIAEELSPQERKVKKILTQNLKAAKSQKLNAYIKGNKLYVNNEVYTAQQLAESENGPENKGEHEDIDNQEKQEISSAPATPNITKKRETEEENFESENHFKKIKIATKTSTIARSSSRIQGKEIKNQTGKSNDRKPETSAKNMNKEEET